MKSESTEKTPMDRVWVVVLSTMFLTVLFVYGWHSLVMRSLTADHKVEKAIVRAEMNALMVYRDQLKGEATSTARISNTR